MAVYCGFESRRIHHMIKEYNMANKQIFNTRAAPPRADTRNRAGGQAYRLPPRQQLAQLVATGCLNRTYYADAEAQLSDVLALAKSVDAEFVARAAIWSRQHAHMKDMPALLTAVLAAQGSPHLPRVFAQVINSGKMLRNFVQIMRSGVTGRKSLGTRPKKLVQAWLNNANEGQLLAAAVGNQPSLADVVKMVHPKPTEIWREAFFAWLIGREHNPLALPPNTQALQAFRAKTSTNVPDVPFLLLSNETLSTAQWVNVARGMSWQALRMNLNHLARHGVFASPKVAAQLARRLADPAAVAAARVYPYQLLMAYRHMDAAVPLVIREALQDALDHALANIPHLGERVVVCPDVSGSMRSAITGYREGSTSQVRCVDVAALFAAAILRTHKQARVLPFEQRVVPITLNPRDSVLTNAEKLAAVGGGGTDCSAPLAQLAKSDNIDTVILISDNESWIGQGRHGGTATLEAWEKIRQRNRQARLVCIDLQPNTTTQAPDRADILNVGGFGDAVFDVVAQFAHGAFGANHWVDAIAAIPLD